MTNEQLQFEVESLNGELFAIRALMFYFLDQMSAIRPDIVKATFDNAANHAEQATIKAGKTASPQHISKALEIIEDLRSKIIPAGK